MIIGKTQSSMLKNEIFGKVTEVQVLTTVFPEVTSLPCVICSPLRADRKPSFSIYVSSSGHVYYRDFAHSEVKGGLLDLLCQYWNLSLSQTLAKIAGMMIKDASIEVTRREVSITPTKESCNASEIQVSVRPWRDYDYEYWKSYGIERSWLKYAEIYPISHQIIFKEDANGDKKRYVFPADKYAYCFVERKEGNTQLKIYQPYNKKGYKWVSKMDRSVVGLWSKIPEKGDRVIICSSLKDALAISCQLHIPTLCLQGEGYGMSDTAINELKRRYNKVFICLDTDAPGIADSKKLAERTGFINVIPDLGKEKDVSDYYKSLEDKSKFKELEKMFN